MRIPVVASRVMGVGELVEDGKSGILVRPARPDLVADAILRLQALTELSGDGTGEHTDGARAAGRSRFGLATADSAWSGPARSPQGTIVPALARAGFALAGVASATGRTAEAAKVQFGFARAARTEELLDDPDIDVIAVATRHASHAELTIAALEAGKAVFVEKPPCLTADELDRVRMALAAAARPRLVGFNRRHAPLARQLREGVRRPGMPFELLFRVNAGRLPAEHWLNDPEDGGWRLLGEGCHFVDFACWFAGALPLNVSCTLRPEAGQPLAAAQSFSVALDFADGSLATVVYGALGASGLAKSTWRRTAGAARACSMISGR